MTTLREAAQQALEALEAVDNDAHGTSFPATVSIAITDLRAALEQQQDPELSAALGWPGGISDPTLDRKTLLQQVAQLAQMAERAEVQRDALRAELREATEATDDPAVNNLRTLPESIRMLRAEREACAKLCDQYDDDGGAGETWGPRFAEIIRARGSNG